MMTITTEIITPKIAADYLKNNTNNYRKLSLATVAKYAKDMKEGRWQNNGEGIAFGQDGQLKNGQHRLAAIIKAKVAIEMPVARGIDDSVTIFDIGKTRSIGEIAKREIVGDFSNTELAMANAVVGMFGYSTKSLVVEWLGEHYRDVKRASRIASTGNCGRAKRMSIVLAAYLMLEAEKMGAYDVESFFRVFNTGETLMANGYNVSSVLTARKMFEKMFPTGKVTIQTNKPQTELVVLALSDFRDGTQRNEDYQIREPLKCIELMKKIRKADGLDGGDR